MSRVEHGSSLSLAVGCADGGPTAKIPAPGASAGKASAMLAASKPLAGTDCHMHLDQAGLGGIPQDGQRVLAALDGASLDRACILSPGYHVAPECDSAACSGQEKWTRAQNDWTLAEGAKSARLLPFCGVPMGVVWAAAEVKRCADGGARGVKLHSAGKKISLVAKDGAMALDRTAKATAAANIPLLIHILHADPKEVEALFEIAAANPGAIIVAAHGIASNVAMLADAPQNFWIEVSGIVFAPQEAGAHFVGMWRKMDMNRVMLGSDWPLLHPSEHRAWLQAYPLTDEERDKILHANAERLFGE